MKSSIFFEKSKQTTKIQLTFSPNFGSIKNGFNEIALKLSKKSRIQISKTLIFSQIRKFFRTRVFKNRFLDFIETIFGTLKFG